MVKNNTIDINKYKEKLVQQQNLYEEVQKKRQQAREEYIQAELRFRESLSDIDDSIWCWVRVYLDNLRAILFG